MDQKRFMEILDGLFEYAQGNNSVLQKCEVEKRFAEMELNEEQYDQIYRYLFEKKITIQGIRIDPEEKPAASGEKEMEDSRYLNLYLTEIAGLKELAEGERLALAMRLLSGEEGAMAELLEASLYEVVETAKNYRGRGVYLEDLIQEGNIALMQVLKELNGKEQQEEPLAYIREYVRLAVAEYIDGQTADGDEQERIVAKLGLLHEAAKYMAGENGVLPDAQELADFTKLPVEEVTELVRLSKNVDFFGKDWNENL